MPFISSCPVRPDAEVDTSRTSATAVEEGGKRAGGGRIRGRCVIRLTAVKTRGRPPVTRFSEHPDARLLPADRAGDRPSTAPGSRSACLLSLSNCRLSRQLSHLARSFGLLHAVYHLSKRQKITPPDCLRTYKKEAGWLAAEPGP